MESPTLQELLEAGVHFGHHESRWHPKMGQYIFGARNHVHIINLEKTQTKLQEAMDYVRDLVARGGIILFLGSKKQARHIIQESAEACAMPYVVNRWLGGTLTNFHEISSLIKKYHQLKGDSASGALAKYTKKEQAEFAKTIADLETKVGGIKDLTKTPDAIFIIDIRKEKTALAEARAKKVPIVALVDTNVNPEDVQYPIPSNDDAVKTIELMTKLLAAAVNTGKELRRIKAAEVTTKAAEANF